MREDLDAEARTARLDSLILELRALRESAGVSYRDLAARIRAQRETAGVTPAAARIALSTVSDMFRLGRARINADLFAEIACALEDDPSTAQRWRDRAREAMVATVTVAAPSAPIAAVPAVPVPSSAPRPQLARVLALVLGGLLLNATGKFFNPLLGDVLFFDMIGTALVALLVGPWAAAATGVLFVLVELMKSNVADALFALTMISAGLIWGYGARLGADRTLPRFLGLSAVVAVATSVVAVPITLLYQGGETGRGLDELYRGLVEQSGGDAWVVTGGMNLAVSLVDKLVTGAIAYGAFRLLRPRRTRR